MSTGLHSVRKAALMLRTLATFSPRGISLAEACEATGIPKATAHRILATLVAERLVDRPSGTRLYRLGPEMFAFGTSVSSLFDFRELASGSLVRISSETGEIAFLGIRSGYDALCLDRQEGANTPKDVLIKLMDRWPLGIGVFSLALLAYLPNDEIQEILNYNERRLQPHAHFSAENLSQALSKIRAEGYVFLTFPALLHSEPKAGIAVPIFDAKRNPIASLCIIAAERRMRGEARQRCLAVLTREAETIARKIGRDKDDETTAESWHQAIDEKTPRRTLDR
jgi:DNA-binding IclR family transcriptional regulator